MTGDAEITGVCPECKYLYTERIHPFPSDSLPCCPSCGSRRRPYPVGAAGLPSPPDLIPIAPEDAFQAKGTSLFLVLVRDRGYRMGCFIGAWPHVLEHDQSRLFSTGSDRGDTVKLTVKQIEAAWEVGDRPGHHE